MKLSKHNILTNIKDSNNSVIVNLLSGNADILTRENADKLERGEIPAEHEYREKGYVTENGDEKKRFNSEYLDFIDERETDEVQLFFVPWYACNFTCSYCYQSSYNPEKQSVDTKIIDAFFNYITRKFNDRKKYITLFGGEPLLDAPGAKETITYFLDQAKKHNVDIAMVTNGYTLLQYLPLFKKGIIREIQVTLDGTKAIHDQRRTLHQGESTFDRIVDGINRALEQGFTINLRVVVDKENFDNLIELKQFADKEGWTGHPGFKTQLGRNYNLHSCTTDENSIYSRIELGKALYDLIAKHPDFVDFYKPAFSISKFLEENGMLPAPLFDSCPGCKTEWAFDYSGRIYPCTATVGKDDEMLGRFYPEIELNDDLVESWQERDVTTIPECKDCSVQLACGGGCASVAKNESGRLHSPDCRPIKELIELGIGAYFKDE